MPEGAQSEMAADRLIIQRVIISNGISSLVLWLMIWNAIGEVILEWEPLIFEPADRAIVNWHEMAIDTYIHHRSHRFGWYWHTHDYLEVEKSFQDIWSYMIRGDRLFPGTVYPCLRNHPGRDSWILVGSPHIQTTLEDLCTAHVCHLQK